MDLIPEDISRTLTDQLESYSAGLRKRLIDAIKANEIAVVRIARANPAGVKQNYGKGTPLFKGFMTIFSTGMQDMAKRMRRCGIESTSHPYHEWGQIAEELIRQPKHGRLILGGHSLGADASLKLAARLGEHQVEVAVVIMVDPYRPIDIPRNVATALNFYQSDGWSKPIPRENFTGLLLNVNVDGISESGELDHFSIDESADVHRLAIDVSLSAGATVPESERQRVARGNVDEGPSLSH